MSSLGTKFVYERIEDLNVKERRTWNVDSVGKLLWKLVVGKNALWIRCCLCDLYEK